VGFSPPRRSWWGKPATLIGGQAPPYNTASFFLSGCQVFFLAENCRCYATKPPGGSTKRGPTELPDALQRTRFYGHNLAIDYFLFTIDYLSI